MRNERLALHAVFDFVCVYSIALVMAWHIVCVLSSVITGLNDAMSESEK